MSSDESTKILKPAVTTPPTRGSFGKGMLVGAACVAVAGYVVGTEDRYPLRVEYELAKTCIDGGSSRLSHGQYLIKQEQCFCALEGTMKEVAYDKYQKEGGAFVSAFRGHTAVCVNKGRR